MSRGTKRTPASCVPLQYQHSELLDAHAGDRPADYQLLDLLGAFEDVVGLIWTCPLLPDVAVYGR